MSTELVSLRMPIATLETIRKIASVRRWSQSQTIVLLLESALQAPHPEGEEFRSSKSGDFALPVVSDGRAA